jgi:hypothetical protein
MDEGTSFLIALAALGTSFLARPFLGALVILVTSAFFHRFGGAAFEGLPMAAVALSFAIASAEGFVLWRLRGFWEEVPLPLRAGGHAALCLATGVLFILHAGEVRTPMVLAASAAVVAAFFLSFEWSRLRDQLLGFDPGGPFSLATVLGAVEVVFTVCASMLAVFFPVPSLVGMLVAVIAGVAGAITRRWWERKAEVACEKCGVPVHACAFVCAGCGHVREAPRRALWTGRPGGTRPCPRRGTPSRPSPSRWPSWRRCAGGASRPSRPRGCGGWLRGRRAPASAGPSAPGRRVPPPPPGPRPARPTRA